MNNKILLFSICFILLSRILVLAQVRLIPGQQYQAGQKILSAESGIRFTIPVDWLGGLPQGGAGFILGSNTKAGVGLVIMRSSATIQDIQGLLSEPQDLGDGVVLLPTTELVQTQTDISCEYSNGIYFGYAEGRLSEKGNGAVVFFAGPQKQSQYYKSLVLKLVSSMEFIKPDTSTALDRWKKMLSGMMLKRMSSYYSDSYDGSYVGGSSSETLHLCSDGRYAYSSSSDFSVDGGGYSGYNSGGNEDYGMWNVEIMGAQVTLVLKSTDGSQSMHKIELQGEETYVDGERAYCIQSDRCR